MKAGVDNKRQLSIAIIMAAILLLLFSYSCQLKAEEPVKIGCILDLTGSAAIYGNWSLNGLQLSADEINQQGGLRGRKIDLILEDGESSPQKAVSAVQKLIDVDKVQVVIITAGSSSVLAVAPIANRKKVILFTPAASSPDITQAGDYVFRNRISGLAEVEEIAKFAYEKLNIHAAAALIVNNDFGVSYGDTFKKTFGALGGRVVAREVFEQGATDFRSQLAKLKGTKGVQAVYLVGYVPECGAVLKQAKEIKLNVKWLSTIGIESEKFLEIAAGAANGVFYTAPRYDLNDPSTKEFDGKYRARFKEGSQMYAANSYDALKIILLGMEKSGESGEQIKNALYTIKDYPGVTGITTFDKNGDVKKPVMVKVVRNGGFVPYQDWDVK
jgi:branched-chain amino acid transport system substrate-binding protein